jgi:hypothetical protein
MMCELFSFVVTKDEKIFYFNKEQRKAIPEGESADSHSYICSFYGLNEDRVNKYEYLKELERDSIAFSVNKVLQDKIDYFVKNLNLIELITNSNDAYMYCREVKDRAEVRKLITNSNYAYMYCRDVKDRAEVRKLITNSFDAYRYCLNVKDRAEVRKLITNSFDAYMYCRDVKDRAEVRKYVEKV